MTNEDEDDGSIVGAFAESHETVALAFAALMALHTVKYAYDDTIKNAVEHHAKLNRITDPDVIRAAIVMVKKAKV